MPDAHANDPLHGLTLKAIVEDLVSRRGWPDLASHIRIKCFSHEPSIKSSLAFLRKTPWARAKVEKLYLADQRLLERNAKRNRRRKEMRAQRAEHDAAAETPAGDDDS